MNDADDDDIIPSDGTGANPPPRFASLHSRCLLSAKISVIRQPQKTTERVTHVYKPANCARNALRKLFDGDCIVGRGLVPSHDLATPFAVTGPLRCITSATVKLKLSRGSTAATVPRARVTG